MMTSLRWRRQLGRCAAFLLLAGAFAGCSSTEAKRAEMAVPAPQSHRAYTEYASDQLSYWWSRANQVPEGGRSRFAAAIRDAQVSLDQLERAEADTWRTYRSRMEDSLSNVERVHRQARLER